MCPMFNTLVNGKPDAIEFRDVLRRAGLPEVVRVGGDAHIAVVMGAQNVCETRALVSTRRD